jgi:alanyl aminopeptidase
MRRIGLAALALALLACSSAPPPPAPPPGSPPVVASPEAAPTPPAFRLPDALTPLRQAVTLTLVPTEKTFAGSTTLEAALARPSRVIWLHARELELEAVFVEAAGVRRAARLIRGGDDLIGLALEADVPAGPIRVEATWKGQVSASGDHGLFAQRVGDAAYLFSQLETTSARRVFPCFDEPGVKIPWTLTLRVRPGDVAIANTPVASEATDAEGMRVVRFAETKPLPSYLVAVAVGPFDLVPAGRAGRGGAPLRFAVPRGKAPELAYAAAIAPRLVDLLEDTFGVPYPYEKLDVVAVPVTASFGAMENAGLITIASNLVLATPAEDTPRQRRRTAIFLAHEMAHQWFGDLVTMRWWDDVWLNEGFATWMERRIAQRLEPAFHLDLEAVLSASEVMEVDGLVSARRVRQPVESADDIENALDDITYTKGGALLDMFEAWMGEASFRAGVTRYLERHAHGGATSDDFLAALGEGGAGDVKRAFSTFLDQPGVPIVSAKLACGEGDARVSLTQERFLPLGSKGDAAASRWEIPVCARYGAGKESGRACGLLADAKGELALPRLAGPKGACPEWVMPNAGGTGYYRVAYTERDLAALLGAGKARLTPAERLSVAGDARALAMSGRISIAPVLALVPGLLADPAPEVQGAGAALLDGLRGDVVDAELRPALARFVTRTFGSRARALGWVARPADTTEVRDLRSDLLELMIELGDDPALLAEARAIASRWLDDPASVDPDSLKAVLRGAALRGDRAAFDRFAALARGADPRLRDRALVALAGFGDPALARASLELFLDPALDPLPLGRLVWGQRAGNIAVWWELVKERFDPLMARTPEEVRPYVLSRADGFCDEARRADYEAFLRERAPKVAGAPRVVAQTLEAITLCVARKAALRDDLRAFLARP